MIAWSDRRRPLILEASHDCKATLDRRTRTKCSVFKIRWEQLTCWHVENKWVLGPEARVRDRWFEEQLSTWGIWWRIETEGFHLIEFNSSVFSKSCRSKRLQALSGTSCLYQKRGSKLKVRRTLLINHRKIIMWGHLRIAHKETHTVNNTCHSFQCSSLYSASLFVCVS